MIDWRVVICYATVHNFMPLTWLNADLTETILIACIGTAHGCNYLKLVFGVYNCYLLIIIITAITL